MDNYEEKYKAALGWMRSLYNGLHGVTKEEAEHYFPELKESEDEMIRKDIISYLRNEKIVKRYISDIEVDKWIAWLEKQQSFDKDKLAKGFLRSVATSIMNWLDANTLEGKMCLSNMECEDIENAVCNADWSKIYAYMRKKLENQGEQKFSDFSDIRTWKYIVDMVLTEKDGIGNYLDNPDTERIAKKLQGKFGNIEKQGEQPTDKIEPKMLDADEVIEWLKTKVYDDSALGRAMIDQFKKDFGL